MARSQAVRSHVCNQPDVPRLIFRRKRPALPLHVLVAADALDLHGLPVQDKALPGIDGNGPEAQRLHYFVRLAVRRPDGSLHLVEVGIPDSVPEHGLGDRQRYGNLQVLLFPGGFHRLSGHLPALHVQDFHGYIHVPRLPVRVQQGLHFHLRFGLIQGLRRNEDAGGGVKEGVNAHAVRFNQLNGPVQAAEHGKIPALGRYMFPLRIVHQNGNRVGALFQEGSDFITESGKRPLMPAGRLPVDGNLGNDAGASAADEIPLARPGGHRKSAGINGGAAPVGVAVDGLGVSALPLHAVRGILRIPGMGNRHLPGRASVEAVIPGAVQGMDLTGISRQKGAQGAAQPGTRYVERVNSDVHGTAE